ncbi:MAG TPA: ABC transporter ATP-binding protein [Dehalococcoidia bacterium]|nr:ABC transporter ATP-binding protein [Dehalococcoidia bacterium]
MATDQPALRCAGLRKAFGRLTAVDGVDLTLRRGEFLALLGPSGCGKTTTLRLIAGFERPDAGWIEIAGETVVNGPVFVPPERRRIGMVFQDYALFPHLDVAGNVAFGLPKAPDRADRVREVLDLVGLGSLGHRYPHELSGGQQQRVAIARALAPSPALVLLDEPFSNLDAALRTRVRAEVREILARAGVTVIFVTHDQAEALSIADQVAVMWAGRLLQAGPPEEVYREPASREVAIFVGDMDPIPGDALGDRAHTELGDLPLRVATIGPVEVLIPPEAIRLEAADDGPAEIVWREFFGHDQRLTLRLPSGRTIHARLDADQDLRAGRRVRLRLAGPMPAFPAEAGRPATAPLAGRAASRP